MKLFLRFTLFFLFCFSVQCFLLTLDILPTYTVTAHNPSFVSKAFVLLLIYIAMKHLHISCLKICFDLLQQLALMFPYLINLSERSLLGRKGSKRQSFKGKRSDKFQTEVVQCCRQRNIVIFCHVCARIFKNSVQI